MSLPDTTIFVRSLRSRIHTFRVRQDETIKDVKAYLQTYDGTKPSWQVLQLKGSGETLNDNATLRSCGIKDGDTLDMVMQIFVKPLHFGLVTRGSNFTIMVNPMETHNDLKAKIFKLFPGVPMELRVFFLHQGKYLYNRAGPRDAPTTLAEEGVTENCEIVLANRVYGGLD